MSFPISDALTLIRSALLLLQDEPTVLASPEDADYFRIKREKSPVPLAPPVAPPPPVAIPTLIAKMEKKEVVPIQVEKPASEPPPEPKKEIAPRPSSQLRAILEKVAPELAILDAIPDDTMAKQIANRWKTKNQSAPISILSSGELPQHKAFLAEIATALDVCFGPAKLVEAEPLEKEKQWKLFLSTDGLKLIVVCDSTLWQMHQLRQFYKETPATAERTLANIPIFLLPDLSLYLKDPLLKRSLWKALCSRLS